MHPDKSAKGTKIKNLHIKYKIIPYGKDSEISEIYFFAKRNFLVRCLNVGYAPQPHFF